MFGRVKQYSVRVFQIEEIKNYDDFYYKNKAIPNNTKTKRLL